MALRELRWVLPVGLAFSVRLDVLARLAVAGLVHKNILLLTTRGTVGSVMTTNWRVHGYADGGSFLYDIKEYDDTYYVGVYEGILVVRRDLSQHDSLSDAIEAINEHVQEVFGANPDEFEVEEED